MEIKYLIFPVVLGVCSAAFGQVIDYGLSVSDGAGGVQVLHFGLAPTATDGIDPALGEAELPPMPPNGIFDARFVGDDIGLNLGQGSLEDYRQGDGTTVGSRVHEIKYQVGTGTIIKIDWNWPAGITGRLQDLITGTLIDISMSATGEYTVANPGGFARLKMTVQYDHPLPIQLSSFTGAVCGPHTVGLYWETLSEIHNYGFIVQRRTLNEELFEDIPGSFTGGEGTSSASRRYSYKDTLASTGWSSYRLRQLDLDGTSHFSEAIQVESGASATVQTPNAFGLSQNYPNPFNPTTTIRYGLPSRSHVTLTVFNTLGQQVATLVNESEEAGYHDVRFDGSGLASGMYFYRLQAGSFVQTKELLLLR